MKKNNQDFSHIIDLREVTEKGETVKVSASEKQCTALAERLGQKGIKDFSATVEIRENYDFYKMTGSVKGSILLTDVVTLDDFWQEMDVLFAEDFKIGKGKNADFEIGDIDLHDSHELDVAEVAIEYLSLEIPPYPRKEGDVFAYREFEEAEEKNTPFAGLKDKMGKKD